MPHHHLETDLQALEEAAEIQTKTLDALQRIQTSAAETEELGVRTLSGMKEQKDQFSRVFEAADRVDAGLLKTEKLQDRLSVWSLRFNKRSAKSDVDKQRKDAKKLARAHAKLAKQRLSEKGYEDETVKKTKKDVKSKSTTKKSKNSRAVMDEFALKKDLLYGVDTEAAGEHKDKLEELNAVDKEIDQALDSVAVQVETILSIGKEMKSEINSQDRQMDTLVERMERTKYKQDIVNKRTTKFLDGDLRKQHQMVDTLSPVSVASKALTLDSTLLDI